MTTRTVVVIVFDAATHRDNEKTYARGPFDSMDAAHAYVVAKGVRYYHIVALENPYSRG